MRLCRSSVLIITCFSCLGFDSSRASTATPQLTPEILELAQASSPENPFFVALSTPTPQVKTKSQSKQRDFIWWSLLGLGILGSVGAILYLVRRVGQFKEVQQPQTSDLKALSAAKEDPVTPPVTDMDDSPASEISSPIVTSPPPPKLLPAEATSRLAKLDIVNELIKDLSSHEPTQRRKAIWDLGQQGDSRAIRPLTELLIDADSQQRSLVLAALAEISTRTLKPMNRALAISMQDESPQVRQNAIRDLTRVYDMMAQMSQMLGHALEDPDAEVQATARYALTQMNRMRSLPNKQNLPED
jgi:HEAT repeats